MEPTATTNTTTQPAMPMKRIVVRKAGPVRLTTRAVGGYYCYANCCC